MREGPIIHSPEESTEPTSILDKNERDAVTEIHDSLRLSLGELREQIVKGSYTLIIGEDASGRLPTLMARRILKSVAEKNGERGPETLFFAGSRYAGADPHGIPENGREDGRDAKRNRASTRTPKTRREKCSW